MRVAAQRRRSGVQTRGHRPGAASRRPSVGLAAKVLIILGVSLVASVVFTGVMGSLLGDSVKGETRVTVLGGLFLVMFSMSLISLIKTFVSGADFSEWKSRKAKPKRPPPRRKTAHSHKYDHKEPKKDAPKDKEESDEVELGDLFLSGDDKRITVDDARAIRGRFREAVDAGVRLRNKSYFFFPALRGAKQAATAESAPKPAEEPPKAPDGSEDEKRKPEGKKGEHGDLASFVVGFLRDAMGPLRHQSHELDKIDVFGVDLFLAGACVKVAEARGLKRKAAGEILVEALCAVGSREPQARMFADKCFEYPERDERYGRMFDAGAESMASHLHEKGSAKQTLVPALDEWRKTRTGPSQSEIPLTIMFTDMVGSTALAQGMGDEAAQQVLRAHNTIVRDALAQGRGLEVKHTGDGIMASFRSPANAIEAALEIQRAVREYNKENRNLPLSLRIGLNVGEAIQENEDLFGTSVQLAARICDEAGPGQIFAHEVVRALCAGRNFPFVIKGARELKGIKDPVVIHELVWDKGAPIENIGHALKEAELAAAELAAVAESPAPEARVIEEPAAEEPVPEETPPPSEKAPEPPPPPVPPEGGAGLEEAAVSKAPAPPPPEPEPRDPAPERKGPPRFDQFVPFDEIAREEEVEPEAETEETAEETIPDIAEDGAEAAPAPDDAPKPDKETPEPEDPDRADEHR